MRSFGSQWKGRSWAQPPQGGVPFWVGHGCPETVWEGAGSDRRWGGPGPSTWEACKWCLLGHCGWSGPWGPAHSGRDHGVWPLRGICLLWWPRQSTRKGHHQVTKLGGSGARTPDSWAWWGLRRVLPMVADNKLATGAVYHICSGEQKRCRMKLARGDKREMVHLDHWRLLSPAAMMNAAYLRPLGERLGRKQLEAKAQAKTAAPAVDPPGGTGLEAAVEAARKAVESIGPAKGQARERSPRRKHSQSPSEKRGRTRSLDEHLRKGIERTKELERSRSKKRGRTDKRDRRRHSRGGHGTGSRERSSDSSRSSGSSHFRKTSARGGDLWRVAQKKPGHLAVRSLNEMTRYLSERTDWAEDENAWSGQKVMAYLNQVVLVNHQPAKIGVRSTESWWL